MLILLLDDLLELFVEDIFVEGFHGRLTLRLVTRSKRRSLAGQRLSTFLLFLLLVRVLGVNRSRRAHSRNIKPKRVPALEGKLVRVRLLRRLLLHQDLLGAASIA